MDNKFLGVGLYTALEAGKLIGASSVSISRWLKGYNYKNLKGVDNWVEPIWKPWLEPDSNQQVLLTFRDLMEVRFINAFRKAGLPLQTIRSLYLKASKLLDDTRPFSKAEFKTDGKTIFFECIPEEKQNSELIDLKDFQYTFKHFIEPTFKDVDYDKDQPILWWPKHENRHVVLDPKRSFGQPILNIPSIPTSTIYIAYLAFDKSTREVADAYEIPVSLVTRAVNFEQKLAGI